MENKNAMIMFPFSAVSSHLGKLLLTNDYNVKLYAPSSVSVRQAGTIPFDLKIAALALSVTVELVKTLDKLDSMDVVVFPSLDVVPSDKRSDFMEMCRVLFRLKYFKILDVPEKVFF